MKLTIKLFLIISLFCSVALAGDMDEGGLACSECVVEVKEHKDFSKSEKIEVETSFVSFIRNFFGKMFG